MVIKGLAAGLIFFLLLTGVAWSITPYEEYLELQNRLEAARRVIRQDMEYSRELERIRNLPPGHPEKLRWEEEFLRNNPWWEFVPRCQWPDK